MLGRIELELLATVERGDTISDLAVKLDSSESYISRAVSDLEEMGLVFSERDVRRKRVIPSDAKAVELYQDIARQHPHIDFSTLLTGKSLEILYHLDKPRTVSELAEQTGNYRNTVNRVLKRLRDRGLVGTDNSHYHFNGDFDRLYAFARELVHHQHRQQLESIVQDGSILWEGYDEFLVQTQSEIDRQHYHETGLARFAAYNLQFLLTSSRYYFFSASIDSISPADLCCHTLLIDDGVRYRSYCLLLLSRLNVDEDDLRDRATKYGIETEIDALIRYLKTEGHARNGHFPEWTEFEQLAADYEVQLSP
ncbi:winged helix DNA-binding protein [Haladaptatus sp. DYSN1]|uniref:winged helix DNA-binding protein n=1 Tax=unclassified Haladaptatus TaxID=2622732 RepID=UPI002404F8A3|nr:winged helix DNA-binding protein [Haladaptatus sp. DYSN1]